jgi:hypothetical protein
VLSDSAEEAEAEEEAAVEDAEEDEEDEEELLPQLAIETAIEAASRAQRIFLFMGRNSFQSNLPPGKYSCRRDRYLQYLKIHLYYSGFSDKIRALFYPHRDKNYLFTITYQK